MQVYKFGGASVKDAAAIKNVAKIVSDVQEQLCVVVSAMGKTTNALEKLHDQWFKDLSFEETLQSISDFHLSISNELGLDTNNCLWKSKFKHLKIS